MAASKSAQKIAKSPYIEIVRKGCGFSGREKKFRLPEKEGAVFVASIEDKKALRETIRGALENFPAFSHITAVKKVYIKINIGGGITGLPGTYTEPEILRDIVLCLKDTGAQVFVCEGDMRGFKMTEDLLRKRGILQILQGTKTSFVALSYMPRVAFECEGVDIPLYMPKIFFGEDAVVVSFAPIKYHWECGVTLTQKNMFGALSIGEKAIYHRDLTRLDHVIAAAARIMNPKICILGGHVISSGIGPHFSVPLNFNTLVFSDSAWNGDKFVSEKILGYPYEKVKHAMLNCKNKPDDFSYMVTGGSAVIHEDVIQHIRRFPVKPDDTIFWRNFLALQYLTPHQWQRPLAGALELPFALVNHALFSWQGKHLERKEFRE